MTKRPNKTQSAGNWTNKIPGCFGCGDKKFALHSLDEDRAWKLLSHLRKKGIGWQAVRKEFVKFLENTTAAHRKQELARVRAHLKPWLGD